MDKGTTLTTVPWYFRYLLYGIYYLGPLELKVLHHLYLGPFTFELSLEL